MSCFFRLLRIFFAQFAVKKPVKSRTSPKFAIHTLGTVW